MTWKIRKMALHLTEETDLFGETNWFKGDGKRTSGEAELAQVDAKLTSQETHQVRTIATVEGEWGKHQPLFEHLRQSLFSDYLDVLADKRKPDPPFEVNIARGGFS